MKVLWLRPSVGDNVSVRRERIAEHLREIGVEVEIEDASGVDGFGAVREALTGSYDVLIGNVRVGLYLSYLLSIVLRKPFIGDVSDPTEDVDHLPSPVYRFICALEWRALSKADACFFVESMSYERAIDRGLNPVLVRNSVDFEMFSSPSEDSVERSRRVLETSDVDMGKPIAIYIGSMVPHYHISEIAEAADSTPDWEFVFVGGERGAEVEEAVSGRDNAYYLGAHDYDLMPGFLFHASAALCLTDKEQPLKVMEYGAAGLPTVALDGKLRDMFSEDEFVFVDAEPREISEALKLIESNPESAEEIAENLQERARDQSWRAIAEEYYEAILEASQR